MMLPFSQELQPEESFTQYGETGRTAGAQEIMAVE